MLSQEEVTGSRSGAEEFVPLKRRGTNSNPGLSFAALAKSFLRKLRIYKVVIVNRKRRI